MKKYVVILIALAGLRPVAVAQVLQILKEYPGTFQYTFNPVLKTDAYTPALNTRDEAMMKLKLESFRNALKKSPVLKDISGFEVVASGRLDVPQPSTQWFKGVRAVMECVVYPWFSEQGKPDYHCRLCTKTIRFYFNEPARIFSGYGIEGAGNLYTDDGLPINLEPVRFAEQNGCQVYENGIVILTNTDKPLWLPVTVREFNEALLKKKMAEMKEKPEDSTSIVMLIARVNDEIAQMTAEQLNAPAFSGKLAGASPVKETPDSRAIVKLNSAAFDSAKSRLSLQIVLLESDLILNSGSGKPYYINPQAPWETQKTEEILKSIDFQALKNLVR